MRGNMNMDVAPYNMNFTGVRANPGNFDYMLTYSETHLYCFFAKALFVIAFLGISRGVNTSV